MNRREFVKSTLAAALVSALSTACSGSRKTPRILIRSAWQTINIGDIAHTPGLLHLLETYLPDAEVYLWPMNLSQGVDKLLLSRFPKLKIADNDEALQAAFQNCDFLLHGSGANLVAQKSIVRWIDETGKPFGIYGITLPPQNSSSTKPTGRESLDRTIGVINQAEFVFFRDSKSLAFAMSLGCTCPIAEFGPDAAFACDLRNDAKAEAFLKDNQLEAGKYLCCIPRLRYSPYWMIPSKNKKLEPDKHAINEVMKEHDHAPLRAAITEVVTKTDLKILICPEDETQMAVGKEMLYDKLPEAIRQRVVWRPNYWLTDEAVSVYVRSSGLFGNDLHSPIMCIGHDIPAITCGWDEQTSKSYMWHDIGLGDWLFDFDEEEQVRRLPSAVLAIAQNPEASKEKAIEARKFVEKRQHETMAILAKALA